MSVATVARARNDSRSEATKPRPPRPPGVVSWAGHPPRGPVKPSRSAVAGSEVWGADRAGKVLEVMKFLTRSLA